MELELSNNFMEAIPIAALSSLKNLKFLNLGSNKIQVRGNVVSIEMADVTDLAAVM